MLKSHLSRILLGCMLGLFAAVAYWRTSPRIYEAQAQVFVNTGSDRGSDLSSILSLGVSQGLPSEAAIIRSEGTFKRALLNVASQRGRNDLLDPATQDALFLLYDVEATRDSRVINVDVKAYDPDIAASLSNEVVDVYNSLRKKTSTESFSNALLFVTGQLNETSQALNAAEAKLKAFKEKTKTVDLSASTGQITGYQNTLAQQLDAALSDDAALGQSISETKAKIASLPKTIQQGLSEVKSPLLDKLELQIADYETQRTELLRVYAPTSTKVAQLDGVIAKTRARMLDAQKSIWRQTSRNFVPEPIRASFEQQLAQDGIKLVETRSRIRSLRRVLATQTTLAAALPGTEKSLAGLLRDREIFQSKYLNLKAKVEEIRLQSNSSYQPAINLYPAQPNPKPISPVASKILPLGLMAGGILGLLFSFARESLRSTARTSAEIAALFELPVVATVPSLARPEVFKRLKGLSAPTYVPLESFRFMASAAVVRHDSSRCVLFTGVGGNVGCSSAAGEFAVAAAKMGVRTILIDADLTFGTLTKAFGMTEKPGLRDILDRTLLGSGDGYLAIPTEHRYLSVLPVGTGNSTSNILDAPFAVIEGLMAGLQGEAELIVVDCPPVDVVADTSRFVPAAQEVCLVVSARKTSLQAISLSRSLLARCGADVVSVVLTGTARKDEAFTGFNRYTAGRR